MLKRTLIIHPKDNVAVVLENAQKSDTVETPDGVIELLGDVEFGHKVSIADLAAGDPVYKYGEEIGCMAAAAPKGTWIHNHNMNCDRGKKARK